MSTLPDSLQGEGERVELLKLFARSDIGLISIPAGPPPSCKTQLGIKISNMGDIQLTHSSHKEVFSHLSMGAVVQSPAEPSSGISRHKIPNDFTCSLNLSERLRLASNKPEDGESDSDSSRTLCGTLARLFLRATRASTDLANKNILILKQNLDITNSQIMLAVDLQMYPLKITA